MKRTAVLALLAILGLAALVGCGPQPPPVHTAPASRRFLKKNTDPPTDYPKQPQ